MGDFFFFVENFSRGFQENLWFFTLRAITKDINELQVTSKKGNTVLNAALNLEQLWKSRRIAPY